MIFEFSKKYVINLIIGVSLIMFILLLSGNIGGVNWNQKHTISVLYNGEVYENSVVHKVKSYKTIAGSGTPGVTRLTRVEGDAPHLILPDGRALIIGFNGKKTVPNFVKVFRRATGVLNASKNLSLIESGNVDTLEIDLLEKENFIKKTQESVINMAILVDNINQPQNIQWLPRVSKENLESAVLRISYTKEPVSPLVLAQKYKWIQDLINYKGFRRLDKNSPYYSGKNMVTGDYFIPY